MGLSKEARRFLEWLGLRKRAERDLPVRRSHDDLNIVEEMYGGYHEERGDVD